MAHEQVLTDVGFLCRTTCRECERALLRRLAEALWTHHTRTMGHREDAAMETLTALLPAHAEA